MVQHLEFKPNAYYDLDAVSRMLGLSPKAIGNACRSGRLRVKEHAGRKFFRGAWVIAWLEGATSEGQDNATA